MVESVGYAANPLAKALKNIQCQRFCRRRNPTGVQYSWERSQILFWISLNLISFTYLCCYSSNIFRNGQFISIQTAQHSTSDDRKIHLFALGLLFVLILGDKSKKNLNSFYHICILHSLHWRGITGPCDNLGSPDYSCEGNGPADFYSE